MFIDEKTPCSSIAQSCLQKLSCRVENSSVISVDPPNMDTSEINERLVPALRLRTVQIVEESHVQ